MTIHGWILFEILGILVQTRWDTMGSDGWNGGEGNVEVWGGDERGGLLITSQDGPPLIHSPMWACAVLNLTGRPVHYTLITPSSTCKYNSCTEESSATCMYESTTRRIEIKQLDASHSSPDHLCLPASINADHGHETFNERLWRQTKCSRKQHSTSPGQCY